MFRRLTCWLVSGVVFLAACGDDGTSPEDGLTQDDAQFVADQIDAEVAGLLNDLFGSGEFGPPSAPALTHGPVVSTHTFERTRPCRDGGTLTVAGGGTRTSDHEARDLRCREQRDEDPHGLCTHAKRRSHHTDRRGRVGA